MPDTSAPLPLDGIRVVELASIGPGPFAAMMLADHGADVVRIEKPGGRDVGTGRFDVDPMLRGRRKVELDLKSAEDVATALDLIAQADVLIEGFRPGVTERLGLGPEACHERKPELVYGRVTGWGQDGPLAQQAGHDINYIAITGALDAVGTQRSGPVPPLNLIGDFGGGGMLMAYGICAALLPAKLSGRGTVIDAAMVEGAALMMTMPFALKAQGMWSGGRGNNLLDGGAPFYGTYQCADGQWVALGAIEEPFWQIVIDRLGLEGSVLSKRMDRTFWPQIRHLIGDKILQENRIHWDRVFADSDACYAPVLTIDEAPQHPHNTERNVFQTVGGVMQPAPAPRYDGHQPKVQPTKTETCDAAEILDKWNGA